MQKRTTLTISMIFLILLGIVGMACFGKQQSNKLIDAALADFHVQPCYEKLKDLNMIYDNLLKHEKSICEKKFSIIETRFRVAERKMYLKQWHLYCLLYKPLDEGFFAAFVKQYQGLIS